MKNKISVLIKISTLILLIILTGCNTLSDRGAETSNKVDGSEHNMIANELIAINDIDNNTIGHLEHYGQMTQTDDSVIYTKIPNGSTDSITEMDYYRYNFETRENIKLGTVKDWAYEASYDTILYDNHVYMLVTTGDAYNFDDAVIYLYDIDLNSNTMSASRLEKGGSPYGSMTIAGNKLFIVRPGKEKCYIDEYDIQMKEFIQIMDYSFDSATNTGETIRHIASDEQSIYLLRLKMEKDNNVQMYVDFYDYKMNFLKSIDVSDILSENTIKNEEKNELRQLVAHFDITNNYIYYRNFSISRSLAKFKDTAVKQVMKTDATFEKAEESSRNNRLSLYYKSHDNIIYLLNTENDLLRETKFYADDEKYYITYMTKNVKDKLLIFMNYKDPDTAETYPPKMYYVDLSELK